MADTLKHKIQSAQPGLVFYSLTPPKITTEATKIVTIAEAQVGRLQHLAIDGLILYDIQDESMRTDKERPFSFIPTLAPEHYGRISLADLPAPKIIYKSIANQTRESFGNWLQQNEDLEYMVFVGASSKQQVESTNFSLADAYQLRKDRHPDLLLGGVTIPERHTKKGDEHRRIFDKMKNGCSFFVSQCVYNINDTKNLLSDYHYENEGALAPLIFTLTPCGSLKTLQFMEWLGIEVPKWLYNDLKNSKDILEASVQTSINIAKEIMEYAGAKGIPVGFNIESISIKKEEINAAQEILEQVLKMVKPESVRLKTPAY